MNNNYRQSDIRSKISFILSRYLPRAIGHSHLMLHGLKTSDRPAVVFHEGPTRFVQDQLQDRKHIVMSISDFRLEMLQGLRSPMAWDHTSIVRLLQEVLDELRKTDEEISHLKRKAEK